MLTFSCPTKRQNNSIYLRNIFYSNFSYNFYSNFNGWQVERFIKGFLIKFNMFMYVLLVCLMKLEIELVWTHPPPKTIAKNNFWILFLPASNPNPSNTSHLYLSSSLYTFWNKEREPSKTYYIPSTLSLSLSSSISCTFTFSPSNLYTHVFLLWRPPPPNSLQLLLLHQLIHALVTSHR